MNSMEWGLIRSFLTVARQGTLTAAAREMAVSQPTLSRDIQRLEKSTGLNLFKRTTQGLSLTEAGLRLMESASRMQGAADQFERLASGLSEELEGEVRISANEVVGIYLLPAALAAFRKAHPKVEVEILISNQVSSLSKREADIALRMFRPEQPDLYTRRLPALSLGFYAAEGYLKESGEPTSLAELASHPLIGFDQEMAPLNILTEFGLEVTRNDFAIRTDSMLMQIALARAGAGICVTHRGVAAQYPELQRVLSEVQLPQLEFWTVCHGDMRYNARIRELMSFLSEWFCDEPYPTG